LPCVGGRRSSARLGAAEGRWAASPPRPPGFTVGLRVRQRSPVSTLRMGSTESMS
jgi:hypothetical protein